MDHRSDQQLITESIAGSPDAFDVLVRRYQNRLVHSLHHTLGSEDDALDAAQQAFVSAWKRLDTFRQDAAFYSWLYRIAMNAAISRKRKQRLPTSSLDQHFESTGILPEDKSSDTAPEHLLESEERVRLVQEALQEISEEFRQPLVLKEIDGFSYEEIASVLNIPIGTVRSRIFRARKELTERLKRVLEED